MRKPTTVLVTILFFGIFILASSFAAPGQAARAGEPVVPQAAPGSVACNVVKPYTTPVLLQGFGGAWDSAGAFDPTVVNVGGSYKMYYSGLDGVNPPAIGLATSTNGIGWTKVGKLFSNLSACSEKGAQAGTVLFDGVYKMWYQGRGADNVWRICYATSPDGLAWTGNPDPVLDRGALGSWESAAVRYPTVLKDGGAYHMWYTGTNWTIAQVGHATSLDGITWTKDARPALSFGPIAAWDWLSAYAPSVVKVGSEFVMFYSGAQLPPKWETGYAISSDGVNWSRAGRIIRQGNPGEYDELSADMPMVLLDGDRYRIWYSGMAANEIYAIGYAEADACSGAATGGNLSFLPAIHRGQPPAYTDNFSDSASGWYNYSDSDFTAGYLDGEYQIKLNYANWWAWGTAGPLAETYTAEVKARRVSGESTWYGLIFDIDQNYQNDFLIFVIKEGNYSVQHFNGTKLEYVQPWTTSSAIQVGTEWNSLKLSMPVRGYPQVSVNGVLLWSASSEIQGEGLQVGLAAASSTTSGVDVHFDNFMMYRYGDKPGNLLADSPLSGSSAPLVAPLPRLDGIEKFTPGGGGFFSPSR